MKKLLVCGLLSIYFFVLDGYIDYKPQIEPYQPIYDVRTHQIAGFLIRHGFSNAKPKDFLDCALQSGVDFRLLPAIALKESLGGKQFTPGTNNIMGIVRRGADGKDYLLTFPAIKASICKSGTLIQGYKAATLEGKIKIYNSVNPNYWSDIEGFMNQIGG